MTKRLTPAEIAKIDAELARWKRNHEAWLAGGEWPPMERFTGSTFVVQPSMNSFDPVI